MRRVVTVIGGIVVAIQFAHLAFVWLVLWPTGASDCAASERWCESWSYMIFLLGVLPQLLFLALTLPFGIWVVASLIGRRRNAARTAT